jgi:hypothetical protein
VAARARTDLNLPPHRRQQPPQWWHEAQEPPPQFQHDHSLSLRRAAGTLLPSRHERALLSADAGDWPQPTGWPQPTVALVSVGIDVPLPHQGTASWRTAKRAAALDDYGSDGSQSAYLGVGSTQAPAARSALGAADSSEGEIMFDLQH